MDYPCPGAAYPADAGMARSRTGEARLAIRKMNWWVVLLTFAVASVVVWLVGRWLFRTFLAMQGARV